MMYWGKLAGLAIGLISARPVLAIAGLLIGHWFDTRFAEGFNSYQGGDSATRLPEGFVKVLFQAMGNLAKADGLVTEDEIRAARSLMHKLNMGPQQVNAAIGWFNAGKEPGFPLYETVGKMRNQHARRPEMRSLFIRLLVEVSLSKNKVQRVERRIIWSICKELDVSRVELAQIEAMLRAQRGFRQSPEGGADAQKVGRAYKTLGIDTSATNDEIKKAYRRLMSKHHPDKIAGSNPDDLAVEEAERATREIRGAYELLKTRRAIR